MTDSVNSNNTIDSKHLKFNIRQQELLIKIEELKKSKLKTISHFVWLMNEYNDIVKDVEGLAKMKYKEEAIE